MNNFQRLAAERYGCCALKKCIDVWGSKDSADEGLYPLIIHQAITLSQDQYANYVVQHYIEKGKDEYSMILQTAILKSVDQLMIHKYGSNVIEKVGIKDICAAPSPSDCRD